MKKYLCTLYCLFVSCSEEHSVSTVEPERNFALNTQQLRITDSVFHPDFNVLAVQLEAHPPAAFRITPAADGRKNREKGL